MTLGEDTAIGRTLSAAAAPLVEAASGPAPERRPGARRLRLGLYGLAWALAVAGFATLVGEVHRAIVAIPVVVALGCLVRPLRVWVVRLATPLFALLALVGFNVAWHWLGVERLPVGAGLVVAVVVFTGSAFLHLRALTDLRGALGVAAGLAVVTVLVIPIGLGLVLADERVPPGGAIVSKLDVLIVTPGGSGSPAPTDAVPPSAGGWSVRYSVARATGAGLEWTLTDSEDRGAVDAALAGGAAAGAGGVPTLREDADHVLVLAVDGTGPLVDPAGLADRPGATGEVAEWRRHAAEAAPPDTPTFALLESQDPARLDRWREAFGPRGVASVQRLGIPALADAAVRLAVRSPEAEEEQALALRFRPLLFFDSRERLPDPLDVDEFFASGRVALCSEDVAGTSCRRLASAGELSNGTSHLRLDLADLASVDLGSTIYVHAIAGDGEEADLLYLDYWWYLPLNPSGAGEGVFCGAGLAIAGVTCFDHQSDWEGMTVVVDRSGAEPQPVAVHYAQHADVAAYAWTDLAEEWSTPAFARFADGIDDARSRPLGFVAAGSHATYPTPCARSCRQVVRDVPEAPHDGARPWSGNPTADCVATLCVLPVPTRRGGTEPALWNAYTGPWGERRCVLHFFCDLGGAPGAPAIRHERYDHPERCDGRFAPRGKGLGERCR